MIRRRSAQAGYEHDAGIDLVRGPASYGAATLTTGIVSLFALLFSGLSLYETVLKQARLHLYVPKTIAYTRDPNGSYEVIAIPITIANSGARDGVVSSLTATIKNVETGYQRTLSASFVAEPGYFSTKENYSEGKSRPKTAFAPLGIPGRSAYTGTILFYPRDYSEKRIVSAAGRFAVKLDATMDAVQDLGAIDQFWTTDIRPVAFTVHLPAVSRFFAGQMLSGRSVRMFVEDDQK